MIIITKIWFKFVQNLAVKDMQKTYEEKNISWYFSYLFRTFKIIKHRQNFR